MSDPREMFANSNVAHVSLKGVIEAPRFVEGTKMRVTSATASIAKHPNSFALERQALHGEPVTVLETTDGRLFGRAEKSGYVGYFDPDDLGTWIEPTHFVSTRVTFAFEQPDIKSPNPLALPMGSQIAVAHNEAEFCRTSDGRYIPQTHLRALDQLFDDQVAVARMLLGTPYLWGGNSAFGIDCSGLVQAARHACGLPCPGDSDQQAQLPGRSLLETEEFRAGDLLFWKGHVAMATGPKHIIHANAHHMAVVEEPLKPAIKRIATGDSGPMTLRLRPD